MRDLVRGPCRVAGRVSADCTATRSKPLKAKFLCEGAYGSRTGRSTGSTSRTVKDGSLTTIALAP